MLCILDFTTFTKCICQCGKAISAYYKLLKVSCPLYIFTTLGFCTLDCIDRDIDGFKWYFLF